MKIAVIGGTGLIGSQVVRNLNAAGHEAVPHSKSSGVDVISGQGVEEAVAGADVVVNLTNSPTFDEASAAFFQTSMDNLLAAAGKGGIGHFVILSIVGVDQVPELDYYRAKALQEKLLVDSSVPYSIVRATQFMEFMDAALSWTADGDSVRFCGHTDPADRLQGRGKRGGRGRHAAPRSTAFATSAAPRSSPWTSWAASPCPTRATNAPSSPTPRPVCSPRSRAMSSPTRTPTSPPPATPTGSPDPLAAPADAAGVTLAGSGL